jgi:hypothetical protein
MEVFQLLKHSNKPLWPDWFQEHTGVAHSFAMERPNAVVSPSAYPP